MDIINNEKTTHSTTRGEEPHHPASSFFKTAAKIARGIMSVAGAVIAVAMIIFTIKVIGSFANGFYINQ